METDNQHDFILIKTYIVGDSKVGKTCIMHRYSDNNFFVDYIPTIGIDFKIKNTQIGDDAIRNHIWDGSGQQRFNSITDVYFKGINTVLVVFDVTNRQSFENIDGWIQKARQLGGEHVVTFLLGNKGDLDEERSVTHEEVQQTAMNLRIIYCEVSALNNTNIDESFEKMIVKYLETKKNN